MPCVNSMKGRNGQTSDEPHNKKALILRSSVCVYVVRAKKREKEYDVCQRIMENSDERFIRQAEDDRFMYIASETIRYIFCHLKSRTHANTCRETINIKHSATKTQVYSRIVVSQPSYMTLSLSPFSTQPRLLVLLDDWSLRQHHHSRRICGIIVKPLAVCDSF